MLETSHPQFIYIGDRVILSVRATIIAHFKFASGVHIEDDVFIGPGAIILPNLKIGRGAVVCAGSVVTTSVPAWTVVQGNPARPIARNSVPLGMGSPSMKKFLSHLRPVGKKRPYSGSEAAGS
jgi:acetyltransferase-like isoleucine patch superfamily enzyme